MVKGGSFMVGTPTAREIMFSSHSCRNALADCEGLLICNQHANLLADSDHFPDHLELIEKIDIYSENSKAGWHQFSWKKGNNFSKKMGTGSMSHITLLFSRSYPMLPNRDILCQIDVPGHRISPGNGL